MQKTAFGNPLLSVDQKLMHDRNLTRRAAKADKAQLEPEVKCFPEGRLYWLSHGDADQVYG